MSFNIQNRTVKSAVSTVAHINSNSTQFLFSFRFNDANHKNKRFLQNEPVIMSFIINFIRNFLHNMLQLLSFSKKTIKNTLSIYVKFNRNTLSVDLDPQWQIRDVKEFVAPQLGLQPNEVKIIFAGKELSDTTKLEVLDIMSKFILMLKHLS